MADSKTTSLTELSATPASNDVVPIVDVSDSTQASTGTTKKIQITNLLASKANAGANSDITSLSGLSTPLSIAQGGTSGATASAAFSALKQAATSSATGVVELAIASELNTGTDADRAVTPDALAGSNYGIEYLEVALFAPGTDASTGDGKAYLHIPPKLNGWNLVYVHAFNPTAGTTGTQDIQIHNLTDTADMLSTKITIDSTERGSNTAATAAVINTSTDDVATNDILRIDVDAVQTTAGKGTVVTLGFQLP